MTFWQRIMRLAGTDWCGNDAPPADHLTWHWKEMGCDKVVSVCDDGFELYFGYPNEWQFHLRRENARKLAVWILWNWWIKGEWFGLRRVIYYIALHKVCDRWQKLSPLRRKNHASSSQKVGLR